MLIPGVNTEVDCEPTPTPPHLIDPTPTTELAPKKMCGRPKCANTATIAPTLALTSYTSKGKDGKGDT